MSTTQKKQNKRKQPKKEKMTKNAQCKGLNFAECELAILRAVVDEGQQRLQRSKIQSEEVQTMVHIVEDFLRNRKLLCYGGTAINNILPQESQFYDRDVELPDYDFFSPRALDDAKRLANLYYRKGFREVEAKAGMHFGTYKVFVNFMPVADITQLPLTLFRPLLQHAVVLDRIHYAPPNFLRMSMYLELSRPMGDTSRWEKILRRLMLLNEHYPVTHRNCRSIDFQRPMEDSDGDGDGDGDRRHRDGKRVEKDENAHREEEVYTIVRDTFIQHGVVFFGGYALSLYSQYMPPEDRQHIHQFADFDVLANDPVALCDVVRAHLQAAGVTGVTVRHHAPLGEIIPEHLEIRVHQDTVAFVYQTIACHSYNVVPVPTDRRRHTSSSRSSSSSLPATSAPSPSSSSSLTHASSSSSSSSSSLSSATFASAGKEKPREIRIATIDTILSFYLAFLYADRPYYQQFVDRLECMASFLFEVQQQNRLQQKGLLRRFSMDCYGHQPSVEDIRAEKAEQFVRLKQQRRRTLEFDRWFLHYRPENHLRRHRHRSPIPIRKTLRTATTKRRLKEKKSEEKTSEEKRSKRKTLRRRKSRN